MIRQTFTKSNRTLLNLYKFKRTSVANQTYKLVSLNNSNLNRLNSFNYYQLPHISSFHTHQVLYKDPESKAEKTVNLLKENIIQIKKEEEAKATQGAASPTQKESVEAKPADAKEVVEPGAKQIDVPRLTLWQRVVKECKHYYHGFKLLYLETKIAYRLLKQVLQGHTLSRRERRQFTRTAADLFRLVPFSVFIVVPFLEFTLPIFLKLFPNMLPSTFQEQDKEQENLKKKLKAKLEMAKFLQDTLEETSLKSDANVTNKEESLNHKFAEFMKKIRTKAEQPTSEEIMKYSSLFENELTLDNLNRQQLIAICQILEVSTYGNIPPNHILRFQLRMRIRNLEADDRVIVKEGIDSLDTEELQQACRDRGMRAIGLSESRLRAQLEQWLDLHLNRKIPLSLLLLSRAMYLPENLPTEDLIKTTISALPQSIENVTRAKIAEVSGEVVDNKIKLELLKQEEKEIKLEKDVSPVPAAKPEVVQPIVEKDLSAVPLKEKLVDKAPIIEVHEKELLTPTEIKEINQIIENLPSTEKTTVKAEVEKLKEDVTEYKEDVKEVEQLTQTDNKAKLTETKSAKQLSKRVSKMIADIDKLMLEIEKEQPVVETAEQNKNVVSINELMDTIKKIRGVSDEVKEKKLMQILQSLDTDKDGKIDDINDVLKVFDLIEQDNVKVSKKQLGKILSILEKEKLIELEEEKAEASAKETKADKQ